MGTSGARTFAMSWARRFCPHPLLRIHGQSSSQRLTALSAFAAGEPKSLLHTHGPVRLSPSPLASLFKIRDPSWSWWKHSPLRLDCLATNYEEPNPLILPSQTLIRLSPAGAFTPTVAVCPLTHPLTSIQPLTSVKKLSSTASHSLPNTSLTAIFCPPCRRVNFETLSKTPSSRVRRKRQRLHPNHPIAAPRGQAFNPHAAIRRLRSCHRALRFCNMSCRSPEDSSGSVLLPRL